MSEDEMTPEAWRLLEVVRAAESPSELDRRRLRRAIAVGAGATLATPLAKAATSVSATKSAAAVTAGAGKGAALLAAAKGVAALAVLASIGVGGTVWWSRRPAREPVAAAPAARPVAATFETPPPSTLLEELTLLQRAQRALADGAPREALSLAGEHASRYPRSQLSRERDAVRVFAYCALGRLSEARALRTEILKSAPRSPLRTSLEQSCATPPPGNAVH